MLSDSEIGGIAGGLKSGDGEILQATQYDGQPQPIAVPTPQFNPARDIATKQFPGPAASIQEVATAADPMKMMAKWRSSLFKSVYRLIHK